MFAIYNKYNPYLLYMHWLTIYKKSDLPDQIDWNLKINNI